MNETITVPLDVVFVVLGAFALLVLWATFEDEVWETKDGEVSGPWPGTFYFLLGLFGAVAFVVGLGHGFYVGITS